MNPEQITLIPLNEIQTATDGPCGMGVTWKVVGYSNVEYYDNYLNKIRHPGDDKYYHAAKVRAVQFPDGKTYLLGREVSVLSANDKEYAAFLAAKEEESKQRRIIEANQKAHEMMKAMLDTLDPEIKKAYVNNAVFFK